MGQLPDDACPYPRPFPEDFTECAVYDGIPFEATNMLDQPMAAVRTCRHLVVGYSMDGIEHRYGQCRLGNGAARLRLMTARILSSASRTEELLSHRPGDVAEHVLNLVPQDD
jgi:hypothetical protein